MENLKKINRTSLKYLVIVAMLIDHIAWDYVPTGSIPGQIMHFIGRLTGPVMAYFLAEGYIHTHDRKKYAIRLGIFALISWIPYSLHSAGHWPSIQMSVIYSLFLGFICLWMWDKAKLPKAVKILFTVLLCIVSCIGDWAFFDVLWPLFFFIYRDDPKKKWIAYSIVAFFAAFIPILAGGISNLFQIGVYMVPFIITFFYNGEGGKKSAFNKWFFYIFYPLHLFILYLLKAFVF